MTIYNFKNKLKEERINCFAEHDTKNKLYYLTLRVGWTTCKVFYTISEEKLKNNKEADKYIQKIKDLLNE